MHLIGIVHVHSVRVQVYTGHAEPQWQSAPSPAVHGGAEGSDLGSPPDIPEAVELALLTAVPRPADPL